MQLSWKTYLILGLVFVGSLIWAINLPAEAITRQVLALPGVASLIGALYQLLRDEAQHQRNLVIQESKQEFDLAITSHMANTVFDKHVGFCEEYIAEFHNAMVTLYRTGGSTELLDHASNLAQIKVRHRAWLTKQIESDLEPFEQALRTIGATSQYYKSDPSGAVSSGKMDEAHSVMFDIFGYKKDEEEPVNEAVRDTEVIQRIRGILGIEKLAYLRFKQLGLRPAKPNQSMHSDAAATRHRR